MSKTSPSQDPQPTYALLTTRRSDDPRALVEVVRRTDKTLTGKIVATVKGVGVSAYDYEATRVTEGVDQWSSQRKSTGLSRYPVHRVFCEVASKAQGEAILTQAADVPPSSDYVDEAECKRLNEEVKLCYQEVSDARARLSSAEQAVRDLENKGRLERKALLDALKPRVEA